MGFIPVELAGFLDPPMYFCIVALTLDILLVESNVFIGPMLVFEFAV